MCTIEWEWVSEGRGGGGNEDGAACSLCPRPRPPVLWLPEQCPGTISAPPQFGLSALDDCFALIRNFPSSWDRLRQFYAFWRIPHGKRGNWKAAIGNKGAESACGSGGGPVLGGAGEREPHGADEAAAAEVGPAAVGERAAVGLEE